MMATCLVMAMLISIAIAVNNAESKLQQRELCVKSELSQFELGRTGEKLFGFSGRPSNRTEIITIPVDVHVYLLDAEEQKERIERWINVSSSRLRDDFKNLAGITFVTKVYVHSEANGLFSNGTVGGTGNTYCEVYYSTHPFILYVGFTQAYTVSTCVKGNTADCFIEKDCDHLRTSSFTGFPLDKFKYNYTVSTTADITILLIKGSQNNIVFNSKKKIAEYTIKEQGQYKIYIKNENSNVTILFSFTLKRHNCVPAEDFIQQHSAGFTEDKIHLIVSDKIDPRPNYLPFINEGVILKGYDTFFFNQDATYFWLTVMKVLGSKVEINAGMNVCVFVRVCMRMCV